MAGVQKRTRNGRTRWIARWRDADGNAHTKTFDRQSDAKRHGEDQERAARHRPDVAQLRRTLTIADWCDHWLDDVIAHRVAADDMAPSTAAGYEQRIRTHIVGRIGHLLLADLTVADVDQLLLDVQTSGRSAGTAKAVRATLSKALTDAGRRDLVDRNVARLAAPPKVDLPEPSAFTVHEMAAIGEELDGHRLWPLYRFIALTGLRASEVLGMRWDDVDLDAGTYKIGRGVYRVSSYAQRVVGESGVVESHAKNATSRRRTPTSDPALEVLRQHRAAQLQERMAAVTWVDDTLVWTTSLGTLLEQSNVRRTLVNAMKAAGVPTHTPEGRGRALHELRRTFATRMLDQGVPTHVVQRLGRWASPQVLLTHYAATGEGQLRDAAARAADGLR